jgi:hypothetical protein
MAHRSGRAETVLGYSQKVIYNSGLLTPFSPEGHMQKKFPVLGFIGLTLIVLGVLAGVCANSGWSLYLIITGAAVLVFALFAGHVKLFG